MRHHRIVLLAATAVFLAACVATPTASMVPVMPGRGKTFEAFAADQAVCQQYAGAQAAPAVEVANNQAVGNVLLGTALTAGLGAAAGSFAGVAGKGAAIAAASGAAFGSAGNAATTPYAQSSVQRIYDIAYMNCMVLHGNMAPSI